MPIGAGAAIAEAGVIAETGAFGAGDTVLAGERAPLGSLDKGSAFLEHDAIEGAGGVETAIIGTGGE